MRVTTGSARGMRGGHSGRGAAVAGSARYLSERVPAPARRLSDIRQKVNDYRAEIGCNAEFPCCVAAVPDGIDKNWARHVQVWTRYLQDPRRGVRGSARTIAGTETMRPEFAQFSSRIGNSGRRMSHAKARCALGTTGSATAMVAKQPDMCANRRRACGEQAIAVRATRRLHVPGTRVLHRRNRVKCRPVHCTHFRSSIAAAGRACAPSLSPSAARYACRASTVVSHRRGVNSAAITEDDAVAMTGLSVDELRGRAVVKILANRTQR